MNENAISEDWFSSIETDSSRNDSKDPIPDAKCYLVRPKDSDIIFIMDTKPDYKEEPFYNSCRGCKLDMNNYLQAYCLDRFDTENISVDEDGYLYTLGICPDENSVSYIFNEPTEDKVDISTVLNTTDNFTVDKEVANHYKIYDWHIAGLLSIEPFNAYIQEHYRPKNETKSVVTSNAENKTSSLNKRLLI